MPQLQVVAVTPFAGIGKASGKPYNMLRVKAVITSDEGVVELGELAFFQQGTNPLPTAQVGQRYEPIVSFESDKGNLVPRVTGLKPIAVSTVPKAA